MKPFYVCGECGWSDNEYKHPHDDIRDAYYCQGDCVEKMQPAFLASDIEKLIKGRIEEKNKQYESFKIDSQTQEAFQNKTAGHYLKMSDECVSQIATLQSLLSALEMGQKERNR